MPFDELTNCRMAYVNAFMPEAVWQRLRYDLTTDINRNSGRRNVKESFAVAP
jgi:hypothetical protein